MWAEKELHNLMKMLKNGVRVPEAVLLKKHVLVMTFIGHDGRPAPKLKDAQLSSAEWELAASAFFLSSAAACFLCMIAAVVSRSLSVELLFLVTLLHNLFISLQLIQSCTFKQHVSIILSQQASP